MKKIFFDAGQHNRAVDEIDEILRAQHRRVNKGGRVSGKSPTQNVEEPIDVLTRDPFTDELSSSDEDQMPEELVEIINLFREQISGFKVRVDEPVHEDKHDYCQANRIFSLFYRLRKSRTDALNSSFHEVTGLDGSVVQAAGEDPLQIVAMNDEAFNGKVKTNSLVALRNQVYAIRSQILSSEGKLCSQSELGFSNAVHAIDAHIEAERQKFPGRPAEAYEEQGYYIAP